MERLGVQAGVTLERLEKLLGEATPRPWSAKDIRTAGIWFTFYGKPRCDNPSAFEATAKQMPRDADLIVAAVNALPGLIRVVRVAQKLRDEADRGFVEQLDDDEFDALIDPLRIALSDALAALDTGAAQAATPKEGLGGRGG